MSYDPNQCVTVLNADGFVPSCDPVGNPTMPANHCQDFQTTPIYHANCANKDIYAPVQQICCQYGNTATFQCFPPQQTIDKCNALHAQDPNWNQNYCYCCCACFARDTLVATPEGVAEIYTLEVGAEVLVGAFAAGDSGGVQWSRGEVTFSSGTGAGGQQPIMVYLMYGTNEAPNEIVCSPDQPFLLADGTFIQAKNLVPGDRLVDRDGDWVTLTLASIGEYIGGVHHIATGAAFTGSADGHMIVAGGVIAGDYDLQLNFGSLPNEKKSPLAASRPHIGTVDYENALDASVTRHDARVIFGVDGREGGASESGGRLLRQGTFKAYRSPVENSLIPGDAQSMFTPAQAMDILNAGRQQPLSYPLAPAVFTMAKKQYAGFFPDVTFAYDTLNVLPNVYAFEFYGEKFVVVSGGLARMVGFEYEAMVMALGWGVACFEGGAPQNFRGLSAIGECDLFAFGVCSRTLWIGKPWLTYVQAAMKQWFALFALISPANAQGNPKDPLNDPSIACRQTAVEMGYVGGALPECAGGEAIPMVALNAAHATSTTEVQLTFSIALDSSSLVPANFTLTPATPVSAVAFGAHNFFVDLTAGLEPGKRYQVTVSGVTSYLGSEIDPAHDSLGFNAP